MNGRRVFSLVGLAVALLAARPALADAITFSPADVGKSVTVVYNGLSDGQPIDALSGMATFTLTGIEDYSLTSGDFSTYSFDFSVTNSTSDGVYSTISSIALRTSPNLIFAGLANTNNFVFRNTAVYSSYPDSVGSVDVCFKTSDSNNCGDATGGPAPGSTVSHGFILGYANPISSLTIDDFLIGYQSITGAGNVHSAVGTGTIQNASGGTPIPEPGMLALFGLAVAALEFRRRRASRAWVLESR